MSKQQRIRVKVCLVGDSGVGKTSLVKRLIHDEFVDRYIPTPSTNVHTLEYEFGEISGFDITLEMDIWDISGQLAFLRFLKGDFFKKARMILGVCDVSRSKTLYNLENWINEGREIAGNIPVQIVGNKADLPNNVIKYDPVLRKLSNEFDASFYFVSAATGQNVESAFEEIAKTLLEDIISGLTQEEEILEFEWEVLGVIAQRGRLGASKEMFFAAMKGIRFDALKINLDSLERKGYIRVKWSGTSSFLAYVTEEGVEKAEIGPRKFDDEALDLVVT
jgi:small GTP-binding protein